MEKKNSVRLLSLLLVIVMVAGLVPMYIFAAGSVTNYDDFLTELKQLEIYADEYAASTYRDSGELIMNFIRTGVDRYLDGNWATLAGQEIVGFTNYVQAMDEENGTTVMNLRDIVTNNFYLPNGDKVDFGHMFGTMNISYVNNGSADLSGWAGDLCDLLYYCVDMGSVPEGSIEAMASYILNNCFGVEADDAFGMDDFYGDMDAYYLVNEYMRGNGSLSSLMEAYFTADLDDIDRAIYFVNNRFGVEDSAEAVRKAIYDSYSSNVGVKLLEYNRGLTSYSALRQACCYAFADYLYENAKGYLVPGTGDDVEVGNGYYTVFSNEHSILAPGIEQDINYAQTVDGKQIVYYIATVDVNRDDVTIKVNYKDNDPSKGWGLQRVEDQAKAMVKNYQNKKDEDGNLLYPNFHAIVATNADGYNITNGTPGGLVIMDGKEWYGVDKDGFFAILKDGSAMIGTKADYEIYKDEIQEGIGGFGAVLVKDGKINVTKNNNYTSSRASRTAIGIKEDGSVVMMVLDGRQLPFSAGGAMEEIAQIMLEAGCVHAVNLDGGGSTTYLSKPAGSDDLQLVNRPSDGNARSVATSLVAVSTAKSSNEFDRAILSSDYEYITAGTSMQIEAVGVSNTGNSAPIPAGATWCVSDETVGMIDEDGMFTALENGDVTVTVTVDGEVVGSRELHVVTPDEIRFAEERIVAVYETPVELSLTLWYQGKAVAFNTETDVILVLQDANAGVIDGTYFIGDEANGIRTVMVGALLLADESLMAFATINMYKADEALFDFDKATQGNRTLAFIREVSNTHTLDDQLYRIVDPDAPVDIEYTFALDMTAIDIPAQLEPLKGQLPGGDNANASAWSFLLQLAERVCTQTAVSIRAEFSKDLDVDISELMIVNEYFTLTNANLDENNVLTVKCNWVDQTAPIDPATANPLCILKGIKATVKDTASYYNNELAIANNGYVNYDIYLAASSLYSSACDPAFQSAYSLYPYIHDPACRTDGNDKGAHFSSQYADFADIYIINSEMLQGWHENYYYVNNVPVTGLQYVPDRHNPSQKRFCEFDDNGLLINESDITGLITYEGDLYYAVQGVAQTGWQVIDENNYYFHLDTGKAVDGVYQIRENANSWTTNWYTYTFEDHILVLGDMVYETQGKESGYRYRWAGNWANGWFDVGEKSYYAEKYSPFFLETGYASVPNRSTNNFMYHLFDDEGVFQKNYNNIWNVGEDTYFLKNGVRYAIDGLIESDDGYYYCIDGNNAKVRKSQSYFVNSSKAHGLVPQGTYNFDETGKLTDVLVSVQTVGDGIDYSVVGRVVSVTSDAPVRVGYCTKDGSYSAVTATKVTETIYRYAIPSDVSEVLVVIAGDANGDGELSVEDKTMLNDALLNETELAPEVVLAADINGDGVVKNSDKTRLNAVLLGKIEIAW